MQAFLKKRYTLIILGVLIVGGVVTLIVSPGSSTPSPGATSTPEMAGNVRGMPEQLVIGHSVEGREIEAYRYGNGSHHVLFVGGIHGGYEWNSVLLARELMRHLENNPELIPENVSATVVPVLNPDGLHAVIGTTTSFSAADAPPTSETTDGRFNAHGVDLNRNFDCNWEATSTWRSSPVDAGAAAFSEPEAAALRDFVAETDPDAAVFFHSAAGAVYGAQCNGGILMGGQTLMNVYAEAAGYPARESFDAYKITGDAEGWFAKIGVPSISVELTNHTDVEWAKNKAGIEAVLELVEEL